MNNELLYFKFRDESILLKDVGLINESSSQAHQEFSDFISKYNLKYSYKNLRDPDIGEIKNSPLYIVYKDKEIHIVDFIKEHNEFSNTLEHINHINGLEINQNVINFLRCSDKTVLPLFIETCRSFQGVYNTFTSARFALLMGELKLHPCSNIPWNNGCYAQLWLRSMYINNAIVWYNSAFDALLQCLWIGKKIYMQSNKGKNDIKIYSIDDIIANKNKILKACDKLSSQGQNNYSLSDIKKKKTRKEILRKCNLNNIIERDPKYKYLNKFRTNESHGKIVTWANELKHKGGLLYKETDIGGRINLECGEEYSSEETLDLLDMDEVITNLANYHKEFIINVEKVYEDLKNEFTQYNLTI